MSDSPAVPNTTLRCCETLSHNLRLAEVVRRFHIRWQTESVESPAFLLMIAQNIMQSLIPTFVHLDSLELHFGLSEHFPSTRNYFPAFAAPLLRHLSLSGMARGLPRPRRPAPPRPPAPVFLPRQPRHRSIDPARAPVQWLSLVGWEFVTEQDLTLMARTSTPVRNLDLSAMSVTPILLRDISRHLYHIECLRVKLALRHTLHFALSGIRLLAALTTVLGEFQELRALDLSPTNAVDGAGSSSAAEEEQLCVSWMRACPSLRRITFPSKTEWTLAGGGTWISEVPGCISRS
ncbi:hypothetical protein EWM64_g6186 [Hericium alpestre]|uniref:F-box domain-containing protein n=1 Tax=Hericium alpestre TaxID=135208 RepID=A0A4Y9ZTD0_9AGAM|nr:hypothetical protein EWM64_g6186 [Hericium alpestre]